MAFHDILLRLHGKPAAGPEPFAALPYDRELALKTRALAEFWKLHDLGDTLEPLVPAPLPRGYRTTSKRRVAWLGGGQVALTFAPAAKTACDLSPLEPAAHAAFWRHCQAALALPGCRDLARALHWLVLRGGGDKAATILVVTHLDGDIVRQARRLAEAFPGLACGVDAALLYVDPSRSEYYLEAERPEQGLAQKHLYGPRLRTLAFDDAGTPVRMKFPPTVFSQVNEAFVPGLVAAARDLLAPAPEDRLLDLYCGYGLFSFTVGRGCREVLGVELAGEAVETARGTADHHGLAGRVRFVAARLDEAGLRVLPPPARGGEVQLLDPPRQGPAAGVIAGLGRRAPRRVLHIACGTDEIVAAVREWRAAGCRLERARPLDLFPGTLNLETLLAFTPAG